MSIFLQSSFGLARTIASKMSIDISWYIRHISNWYYTMMDSLIMTHWWCYSDYRSNRICQVQTTSRPCARFDLKNTLREIVLVNFDIHHISWCKKSSFGVFNSLFITYFDIFGVWIFLQKLVFEQRWCRTLFYRYFIDSWFDTFKCIVDSISDK